MDASVTLLSDIAKDSTFVNLAGMDWYTDLCSNTNFLVCLMTIACTATDTDIIFKISAAFKNVKITRNISPLQFLNDPMFAFVLVQLRFLEENCRCVTNVVRRVGVIYALNLIYFYVLKFQFFYQ